MKLNIADNFRIFLARKFIYDTSEKEKLIWAVKLAQKQLLIFLFLLLFFGLKTQMMKIAEDERNKTKDSTKRKII